ncbi:MAG: MMPL family transporter [Hamadaea sp.]|uniref:MMPL family transporter n=1 Tax=Hamadaea sp. TaxID=2024425 RepID=UPI0018426243|nr:MMPL family transporter [Hamadaea sp.]NUR71614.1 MMPL family transporter [Hamadaea sp.]NUT20178.1 MMPL family transporter [Hamadaea sp.]
MWGRFIQRFRWPVLLVAIGVVIVSAVWGTGVFSKLTGSGFENRASESYQATVKIKEVFGDQSIDLIALYTAPDGKQISDYSAAVTSTLTNLKANPEVSEVMWDPSRMTSTDGHSTYAAIRLHGDDQDAKREIYDDLRPSLDVPGVTTEVGGAIAFLKSVNAQTSEDIAFAETISMPILLLLLLFIFRGLVAAVTPLIVGVIATLGAFAAVRLITYATDVSVFAINIITILGLGMAIDYALFIVSRFREELAAGLDTPAAITRTLQTAGRTVLVSGLTIVLALSSLLVFPQVFLRSMGFGGMAAVGVAMLASLTVLPAFLALLGPRINAGRLRFGTRKAATESASEERGTWGRLAHSVMKRPVAYAVAVAAVLITIALPALRINFGGFDERLLPPDSTVRTVNDRLDSGFTGATTDYPIQILATGDAPSSYVDQIRAVDGVTGANVVATKDGVTLITVDYDGDPSEAATRDIVRDLRDLPPPAGTHTQVSGRAAMDLDLLDSLGERLPWAALVMAGATFLLLFLAFGSVVLPIKAVVMNLISIGASFGVIVWGFQEGHLAGAMGFTSTGFLDPTNLVLILVILFGLATDYEVFLLSRIREEWDATGDNTRAVARGVQHTGGIITAAALLLAIVVGGFATGEMAFVKMMGVGMLVAILVDATLVRMILVPATMRLLGRFNWWAPGPLGAVYRRFGIKHDAAAATPDPTGTRETVLTR